MSAEKVLLFYCLKNLSLSATAVQNGRWKAQEDMSRSGWQSFLELTINLRNAARQFMLG